jgi:ubiquinone/menaquinone biosynthesis C-methylase UbiE
MSKIADDLPNELAIRQQEVVEYYDWFSKFYDLFSGDWYYGRARRFAVEQLQLVEGQSVLNLPCGTGLNYRHFQNYLSQTGLIIGIDLSSGMLRKATQKTELNHWDNVINLMGDATQITSDWIEEHVDQQADVDAVLCDLGLSGFPDWETIIDNLLSMLRPNGRIVIMDWYIPKPTIRGSFIKWIGKGEVDRPLYQYLETRVANFSVSREFCRGGVFVASGNRIE